jgi:hypothetical protein
VINILAYKLTLNKKMSSAAVNYFDSDEMVALMDLFAKFNRHRMVAKVDRMIDRMELEEVPAFIITYRTNITNLLTIYNSCVSTINIYKLKPTLTQAMIEELQYERKRAVTVIGDLHTTLSIVMKKIDEFNRYTAPLHVLTNEEIVLFKANYKFSKRWKDIARDSGLPDTPSMELALSKYKYTNDFKDFVEKNK